MIPFLHLLRPWDVRPASTGINNTQLSWQAYNAEMIRVERALPQQSDSILSYVGTMYKIMAIVHRGSFLESIYTCTLLLHLV